MIAFVFSRYVFDPTYLVTLLAPFNRPSDDNDIIPSSTKTGVRMIAALGILLFRVRA